MIIKKILSFEITDIHSTFNFQRENTKRKTLSIGQTVPRRTYIKNVRTAKVQNKHFILFRLPLLYAEKGSDQIRLNFFNEFVIPLSQSGVTGFLLLFFYIKFILFRGNIHRKSAERWQIMKSGSFRFYVIVFPFSGFILSYYEC